MMPLEIELVTTEKCNLSCAYCYMNNNSRAFNLETFKQFRKSLTKILDIYNTYEYNFSFFGGEPLLNWDFIKQSLPLIRSDKRCKEILMPTNGLLLNQERYGFKNFFGENRITIEELYICKTK